MKNNAITAAVFGLIAAAIIMMLDGMTSLMTVDRTKYPETAAASEITLKIVTGILVFTWLFQVRASFQKQSARRQAHEKVASTTSEAKPEQYDRRDRRTGSRSRKRSKERKSWKNDSWNQPSVLTVRRFGQSEANRPSGVFPKPILKIDNTGKIPTKE